MGTLITLAWIPLFFTVLWIVFLATEFNAENLKFAAVMAGITLALIGVATLIAYIHRRKTGTPIKQTLRRGAGVLPRTLEFLSLSDIFSW